MADPVICQVLHTLNVGGAEIMAANLARALRHRFQFVFACLDELGSQGDQLRREGFEIEVVGRQAGVDWRSMKKLAKYFAAKKVQVIHAHQYTPFFYSAASGLFRKRPGILFTEHGRWHPDLPNRKRIAFNRFALRKRDRVVGVGEHVRKALIDNEGLPADRVGVIYNGVNLSIYGNGDGACNAPLKLKHELSIPHDVTIALQVARLDPLKDHLTAIEAMAKVVKSRSDVHLLLAGDGPERTAIEAKIAEHSLAQQVHLLGSRSDVSNLLRAADIFLLTSVSEGIPLTIIEAMAAGLPVVATAVGGVPEVVLNEITGFLAPPKAPTELADAILALARNPSRRSEMGQAGRRRAQERFSAEDMDANYARAYAEILAGA